MAQFQVASAMLVSCDERFATTVGRRFGRYWRVKESTVVHGRLDGSPGYGLASTTSVPTESLRLRIRSSRDAPKKNEFSSRTSESGEGFGDRTDAENTCADVVNDDWRGALRSTRACECSARDDREAMWQSNSVRVQLPHLRVIRDA
jgi:hypothetical protein